MRKYIVHYGYGNRAYTDTRNARVLCRMYGENVTVTTIQGKFICRGIINYDGTVTVCTIEWRKRYFNGKRFYYEI